MLTRIASAVDDTTIAVTGETTLLAEQDDGNGNQVQANITLAAAGDLDAEVTAIGNATLNSTGNLVADVDAGGNAGLTSGGTMTAVLDVDGNSTLGSGGNLTVSGNSTDLTATSGGTTSFGETTVSGGLSLTSEGGVTQTGKLDVAGTTALSSTNGDIALADPTNAFGGKLTAGGGNVALTAAGDLDAEVAATGNATMSSIGNLIADVQSGGSAGLTAGASITMRALSAGAGLAVRSNSGPITQTGALCVQGQASFDAGSGAVDLPHPDNYFLGGASAVGASVVITGDSTVVGQAAFGLVDIDTLVGELTPVDQRAGEVLVMSEADQQDSTIALCGALASSINLTCASE